MAQTLGTILLALKADTSAFTKGLSDAKQYAFSSASDIVASLQSIGDQLLKLNFDNAKNGLKSLESLGGIVAGLGAAATAAVVEFSTSTAEQAKQLDKLSQSYGVSIEEVSSMRVAAKLTGVDIDTLTMGFGRLARSAAQVASTGTGPAAIAFHSLGISVTDSSGRLRPMSDLMGDVAQKFSTMENGTTKTALAMQLFGRSGAALIPLLNQGRDGLAEMNQIASQMGLTMNKEDVESAKLLAEQMELLELKSTAFKEQLSSGVIPELTKLAALFTRTSESSKSTAQVIGDIFGGVFKYVGGAAIAVFGLIQTGFDQLGIYIKSWNAAIMNFLRGTTPVESIRNFNEALAQGSREARDAWDEYVAGVKAFFDNPPKAILKSGTGGAGGGVPALENISAWNKMVDELNKLSDRSTKLTDTVLGGKSAAQDDALNGLIRDLQAFKAEHPEAIWADINRYIERANEALRTYQERQQAALQRLNAESEQKGLQGVLGIPVATARATGEAQAGSALINLSKDVNAQNQAAAQIYDQTRTSTEAYAQEVDRLNILLKTGSIDRDEYNRALQQAYDRYSELYDPLAKYREELQRINDALRTSSLSQQQENALLKQRADLLRQMQAIDAQQKAQGGGAGSGIRAGLATFGAQWQGIGLESMKATIGVLQSMQNAFANFFTSIIEGTKTIGQAFAQLGIQILDSIIAALAQMLAQWIVTKIAMALFGATTNVSQVASYAAVAGAAAYASTAAIPIIGPAIAPSVALASYFGALSFAPLASAAGGMEVMADQLALVHKDEHIIPAPLAKTYKRLSQSGGGGGGFQQNFTINGATDPDAVAQKVSRISDVRMKRMLKDRGYR